jgi:hypothetical protein
MDQEPEATYETYRTPTTPYRGTSPDGPIDPTIGLLITHSRSLHFVSPFALILFRRALIFNSHATNQSMDIVSDPKLVLQSCAIPLSLHHIRTERRFHLSLTVPGHTDKYT